MDYFNINFQTHIKYKLYISINDQNRQQKRWKNKGDHIPPGEKIIINSSPLKTPKPWQFHRGHQSTSFRLPRSRTSHDSKIVPKREKEFVQTVFLKPEQHWHPNLKTITQRTTDQYFTNTI